MSADLELRWLKTGTVKGAVKRFSEFCKEDIRQQSKEEGFDIKKYQDAVKLVVQKLDKSLVLDEAFSPEQKEKEKEAKDAN